MSEWPPEGCTCTLFREMFSERFQKHLEAQSKIFADKTTKMRSNEALKQRKQSIFDDLPCANGGHSATRFTSMFELCTPAFYLLGVSLYLFRIASTQSFLLCRRNLRGFGSCTGGKPQVSGVFQRQNRRKRALKSTMAAL